MRYVSRSAIPEPEILRGRLASEYRRAVERYLASGERDRRPPQPPEPVLGDERLRQELFRLFWGACAYCETPLQDGGFNIDHYRPWQGADRGDGEVDFQYYCWLGLEWANLYWWLASEWSNLLPACQDCNRARYHPVPGGGEAKFGKENRFPLLGTPRSTALGGEAAEAPALLNPTVDDPRPHLAFSIRPQPDGHDGSVVSLLTARGVGTDEVVGLNRPRLVRARMERITSLRFALRSIEKEWKLAKLATGVPERAAALAVASEETEEVWTHFLKWDAPFSAACRADYRRWRADILAMMAA